ncbi:aliphatic nitrilase [Pseudohyphozyma bogoriensis]|nr:aliphatic nitrilase [Pseudohyphozyma bogoriensis]
MASSARQYKVAAVQASSVYHDAAANTKKTIALLEEAAAQGAKLVIFSELWLSGYPFWCWMMGYGEAVSFVKDYYVKGAVEADGLESKLIADTCKRLAVRAVIGFAERSHGSLYMSQWIFGPDGLVMTRRKLKPSIMERVIFGEGDGSDIKVHDTELGRLGALQCWEHAQPLLTHTMGMQHEEIHCASWPSFPPELPHFSLSAEANASVIQTYAVQTGSYVISASSNLSQQNQDFICEGREHLRPHFPLGCGLTQIYGPEGKQLAERPKHDEEKIIYADVDLDTCFGARAAMDPSGHYARSDVFEVHFDNTPRRGIRVGPHGTHSTAPGGTRLLRKEIFSEIVVVEAEAVDPLA